MTERLEASASDFAIRHSKFITHNNELKKDVLVVLLCPSPDNMNPEVLKNISKGLLPGGKRLKTIKGLARFGPDPENPDNLILCMVQGKKWIRVDIGEFQIVTIHLKHPNPPHNTYHVATLLRNVLSTEAKLGVHHEVRLAAPSPTLYPPY